MELLLIEFRFHKKQVYEISPVSEYLKTLYTETSKNPIYYQWKNVKFRNAPYLALYYSVFYSVNPGYKVLPFMKPFGYHDADVERIVILYDEITKEPKWVYFGSHGNGHGCWRKWDECEKTEDNLLCLYVSYKSHGFYPNAGKWIRAFGFINDVTGNHIQWRPQLIDFQNANDQSWSDTHYQVCEGINTPKNTVDPTENSITFLQRFNLAFPCVRKHLAMQSKISVV